MRTWTVVPVDEVDDWFLALDEPTAELVADARHAREVAGLVQAGGPIG